tara:strand:- start:59 stop:721 length:663 start_codon:yes stop_codon:yes gene_type:complete
MKYINLVTFFLATTLIQNAYARNVEYNFFNDSAKTSLSDLSSALDNMNKAVSFTIDSVKIEAEAFNSDNSTIALFNGGKDGFGINSKGSGDKTQRIDNALGIEKIVFSFDHDGIFKTINLRYIEEQKEEALLLFEGGNSYSLNVSTALSYKDDFRIDEPFQAGQKITLSLDPLSKLGENFSVDSFTINIPEHNASVMGMGVVAFGVSLSSKLKNYFRRQH